MHTAILLLGIAVFAVIAYRDVCTRRIPNEFSIAVAVLGLAQVILAGDLHMALYTIAAAAAVFVVSFAMFWLGWIGGGDAKLLSASALLVGYHDLFSFLMMMGLCGGLLALAVIVTGRFGAPLRPRPRAGEPGLPGPAPAAMATSLYGSLFALAVMAAGRFGAVPRPLPRAAAPGSPGLSPAPARPSVPYGVAIAVAGALILLFQSFPPG